MNETDVICECFNVTYKDLVTAVQNGAKSFEEVQKKTKIGTGCEGCLSSARELVDSLLAK